MLQEIKMKRIVIFTLIISVATLYFSCGRYENTLSKDLINKIRDAKRVKVVIDHDYLKQIDNPQRTMLYPIFSLLEACDIKILGSFAVNYDMLIKIEFRRIAFPVSKYNAYVYFELPKMKGYKFDFSEHVPFSDVSSEEYFWENPCIYSRYNFYRHFLRKFSLEIEKIYGLNPLPRVLNQHLIGDVAKDILEERKEESIEPLINFITYEGDGKFPVGMIENQLLVKIGDPALNSLIKIINKEKDNRISSSLIDALHYFKNQKAEELLFSLLISKNQDTRKAAYSSLSLLWTNKNEDELLLNLKNNNEYRRALSIQMLIKQDPTKYRKQIIKALNDRSSIVRREALDYLLFYKDPIKYEFLRKMIRSGTKENCEAAGILLNNVDKSEKFNILPIAIEALKNENSDVRFYALSALSKFNYPNSVDDLIEVLKDRVDVLRAKSAEILGNIGDQKAFFPLLEIVKNDNEHWVKQWAVDSITKLKDPNIINELLHYADNVNDDAKEIILRKICDLRDPSIPVYLKKIISNSNDECRWLAIECLGNYMNYSERQLFTTLLEDEDPFIRRSAVIALSKYNDVASLSLIIKAIDDQNPDVRNTAIEKLTNYADTKFKSKVISILRKKLNSDILDTKINAASSLFVLKDEQFLKIIMSWLSAKDSSLKIKAVEILGERKSLDSVDSLIRLLTDNDSDVRLKAIEALSKIGDRRSVWPIIQRLKDPDENIIYFTKIVLERMNLCEDCYYYEYEDWKEWFDKQFKNHIINKY